MRAEAVPTRSRLAALAHRFIAVTVMGVDAGRGIRWTDIQDLDGAEPTWTLRASTPFQFEFVTPLSKQAVEILRVAKAEPHQSPLVFPGRDAPHKPMSTETLSKLPLRAGYRGLDDLLSWRRVFTLTMHDLHPEDGTLIRECLGC